MYLLPIFDGLHLLATFGLGGTAFAGLASGILGAGASIYSANKAASAARSGQRNLGDELGGIIGQLPNAGAAGLANQQNYGGAYTGLANDNLQTGLLGGIDVQAFLRQHPEFQQGWDENGTPEALAESGHGSQMDWLNRAIANAGYVSPDSVPRTGGLADTLGGLQAQLDQNNAASSTFQRTSNLNDQVNLAPQADALRRSLNPELYQSLAALDAEAGRSIDPTEGENILGGYARDLSSADPIEAALSKQAQDELALGGNLSDEETRNATAAARAAYSARGLGDSNSALAGEVLNLAGARQARLDSRRSFASGVEGLRLGRIGQGSNTASTFANLATARRNQGFANRLAATNMRAGSFFDPSSVLGTTDNRLNSQQLLGQGQAQFTGAPDYLGALLGYGQDVNSSNANARVAGGLNQANAYAGLGGGLLSAAGSLGRAQIAKTGKLFG